jgi:hypothetical protein
MVDCPRCLGKGHVDFEDIKRLKKEAFWIPGQCAYCNGLGKVPPDRMEKVPVDFEYLTTDLPSWERLKVINGNEDALARAKKHKELVLGFVEDIEQLYYIENKEPYEIADHFFQKHGQHNYAETERLQVIEYVKKVIKSKLKE